MNSINKTILITGSSTGIGRASVKLFQQKGWNVIATMRTPGKEKELNKLANVIVTRLDVTDNDSIDYSIERGIEKFGNIDAVVNNAGYGLKGTFESATRESIIRQFDVNVFGVIDVIRAILPHFRANKKGTIVNVSSIGGKITMPLYPYYHATKFALEGLSESLQYELQPLGIKVKVIEPGAVATDFDNRSLDFQHNKSLTDYNDFVHHVQHMYNDVFSGDGGSKPEKIAGIILEAIEDESNKLRYPAGDDAQKFLKSRYSMSDEEYFALIKKNFQLS